MSNLYNILLTLQLNKVYQRDNIVWWGYSLGYILRIRFSGNLLDLSSIANVDIGHPSGSRHYDYLSDRDIDFLQQLFHHTQRYFAQRRLHKDAIAGLMMLNK